MKQILERLCAVPGVSGAMAVSPDGFIIAARTALGGAPAEETAAAVLGNLGRSLGQAAAKLGRGAVKHLVVSGAGGRAVLAPAGPGFLVATVDTAANLGLVHLELAAAAAEAGREMRL
ncbi:MAG TPA: roadblock/LC7 domain-containing protein [Planctomycetota bacterium]|nr:roadblock/LC7 domain-containing protein [Planctomycetota bacterium]